MSGNSPAGPNQTHLRNAANSHSKSDPRSNSQALSQAVDMLDASAETLDVEALDALLDGLQERAPVMEDFDPSSILGALKQDRPELFTPEEPGAAPAAQRRQGRRKPGRTRRFLRLEVAAAILLLLVISAGAMGFSPVQRLMDWASEILHIDRNPSGVMELPEDSDAEYRSLEEAMLANGVEPVGCPTWVPEDYIFSYAQAMVSDDTIKFAASYVSLERGELFIRVTMYNDITSTSFEKNEGGYTYTYAGIAFNIVQNLDITKIGWQLDSCAYSITGPLEKKEAEHIINSIEIKEGE